MIEHEEIITFQNYPFKLFLVKQIGVFKDLVNYEHWHQSIEIIIPIKNGLHFIIDGMKKTVYPGEIIIINSREVHTCHSIDMKEEYLGYVLQLKYEECKKYIKNIDEILFYHHACNSYKFNAIIDQCLHEYKKENNHFLVNGYFQVILGLLLENKRNDVCHKYHRDLMTNILIYLDENCKDEFDSNQISTHFNFSYGYLSKIFKEYSDLTLKEYVNTCRMKKCIYDLIQTNKTIDEIAYYYGYPNRKSFVHYFKKYYDMTPKEFKKMKK